MSRAAAWVAALVALAPVTAAAAGAITADGSHTVVVLRAPHADEVTAEATARVQGELGAAGFHVVVLPVASESARTEVETAGSDLAPVGAFAIFVRAEEGGGVAEIWVSDRVRQRTVVERARLTETDHERESEVLAVRAVELLKASLAELWLQPPVTVPPPPAPPPPIVRAPPEPPKRAAQVRAAFASGIGLGVGAGMMAGFRDVGPIWLPALFFIYGEERGLSVHLGFHGLGPAVTLTAAAGTAKVDEQLVSVDVVKTWWPRARLVPFASAGVGAQHVHVNGTAAAPYAGATADPWSLLTTAGLGAALPLYSGLSLVAQTRFALAWPPTAVRIADADAGHFGTPSLLVDADMLGVFP
jgi:hypothetical protein